MEIDKEKKQILVILTKDAYILLLLSLVLLSIGIAGNRYVIIIPALLLPFVFIIFGIRNLKSFKSDFSYKFHIPSGEIKAKQFLHISLTIEMEQHQSGIISIEVSDGLFPVLSSQNSLFRSNLGTTFLFYAPRRGKEVVKRVILKFNGIPGLFHFESRIIINKEIIIVPEPQRVTLPWKMKQRILEQLVADISVPVKGRGYEFLALRDFQFGDDVRHIHWRATAKQNKLIVKEFEEPMMLRFLIVVDSSLFMAGPKLEFTLSSVAEIASVIHRSSHSLSVICHGDNYTKLFHLGNSTAALRTLSINLHGVKSEGSQFNYQRLQQFIIDNKLQGSVLILLSDLEMNSNKVSTGISNLKNRMQHIFFLACNSPGFGTLALANVQDERMYDISEINYRRMIVEPNLERIYDTKAHAYKSGIEGQKASFRVIEGYNTNILLELKSMLRKKGAVIRGIRR